MSKAKTKPKAEEIPHSLQNANAATAQTVEWITAYDAAVEAGDDEKAESIQQEIQEDPLSIEWGAWTTNPYEKPEWDRARILLTTGGPALRLTVDLHDREVCLERQDWFTPWIEVPLTVEESAAWSRYADILGVDPA